MRQMWLGINVFVGSQVPSAKNWIKEKQIRTEEIQENKQKATEFG